MSNQLLNFYSISICFARQKEHKKKKKRNAKVKTKTFALMSCLSSNSSQRNDVCYALWALLSCYCCHFFFFFFFFLFVCHSFLSFASLINKIHIRSYRDSVVVCFLSLYSDTVCRAWILITNNTLSSGSVGAHVFVCVFHLNPFIQHGCELSLYWNWKSVSASL